MISFEDIAETVMRRESGGDPNAVSPKGAIGRMQTMPATLRDPGFGVKPAADLSDTETTRVGRDYLKAMLNRYDGDLEASLAAYNWGPGRADDWVKAGKPVDRLPRETRTYIRNIVGDLSGSSGDTTLAGGDDGDLMRVPRIRTNIERMIAKKAPETEIDAYLAGEGFTVEQWRSAARDLSKTLDKKTGAPAAVRMQVGGAPDQDRLANLQRYYPDAIPYGEDNFVFTDPKTKRLTLYNPSGMDVGDLASVGRETTQAIGGALGAVAGTALGPVGTVGGAGIGTASGGALWDVASQVGLGTTDTRTGIERAGDTAADFAGGAIGQRVGELGEQGVRAAIGAARTRLGGGAANLAQDFAAEAIEAPAGAVSGSRMIQSAEHALAATPGGAPVMQDQAERVVGQFRDAALRTAQQVGPTLTPESAGAVLKRGTRGAAERFRARQETLYDDAYRQVGPDTPVAVPAVAGLRQQLEQELAQAPNRARTLRPAIERARAIEADAAQGLPFTGFRATRTDIGRDLDDPILAGATSSQNTNMRRLYAALTDDMNVAARDAGPGAQRALQTADRYTRFNMNQTIPTLQKVVDTEADARAFSYAMSGAKDSGQRLRQLRRSLQPEEWDAVAGTVIGRLGLAKPGAQDAAGEAFSVNTFLTNWNNLAPEARASLFGGTRYAELRPALDRLSRVAASLRETDKMANTSGTARVAAYQATIATLGGIVGGGVLGGAEGGGLGGAAAWGGAVVAPRVAARLITNPRFVNWLASAPAAGSRPNGLAEHLGRLAGIAKATPEIREEIRQYLEAYRLPPAEAPATETPR